MPLRAYESMLTKIFDFEFIFCLPFSFLIFFLFCNFFFNFFVLQFFFVNYFFFLILFYIFILCIYFYFEGVFFKRHRNFCGWYERLVLSAKDTSHWGLRPSDLA